jgi:hypothetical protein
MAVPVWITPPGNLGTIVEGEFYQVKLGAENAVTYKFHSGRLPDGIVIRSNGTVEGYPSNKDYIQGVPVEVAIDTYNQFSVRVTSIDGQVADRIFDLTVTGPDTPVIDTLPQSQLGAFYDGGNVNITLTATDEDPGQTLTWSIVSGDFPPGLVLAADGKISGYIEPLVAQDGNPGFDSTAFDIGTYDFGTRSISVTYMFTAQVSDGTRTSQKEYSMLVVSRNQLTADTDITTTDSYAPTADFGTADSLITADSTPQRVPFVTTPAGDLGTIKHDNWFNYKFDGLDLDGDAIVYEITSDVAEGFDADGSGFDVQSFDGGDYNLPPGLSLDTDTGWFTGTLPNLGATTNDYSWAVRVKKANDQTVVSDWVYFTLTIEGDIDKTLTWPDADLGILETGQVSEFDIKATVQSGASVQYELKSGYPQDLPQGIQLNKNGLLIGRVSFETFMLDTGLTTFDVAHLFYDETTWHRKYAFTVRAYSADGTIDTIKEFNIRIKPSSRIPYESLYVKALPNQTQREIYDELVNSADDINPADVYRPTDYYFGVQRDIRMLIATGLNPSLDTDYIEATSQNHYNNTLAFGDLKTARALNADGSVRYEVVYIELHDPNVGVNSVTGLPQAATQQIDLRSSNDWTNPLTVDAGQDYYITVDSGNYKASAHNDYIAYPNAIENMRNKLKIAIGEAVLERLVLPEWMQSKQEDNKILGWTLAAPLVYCKPGTSKKIKYLLEQRTNIDLKLISFEVDRYILDNNLSKYYDKTTGKYTLTAETSFDLGTLNVDELEKSTTVSATVDHAIDGIAFDSINNRTASDIVKLEYIPGVTDVTQFAGNGIDVIWLQQTGLTSSTETTQDNDGWNLESANFGSIFDADGVPFSESSKIDGYVEKYFAQSASVNQRGGVWNIKSVSGKLVCTFKQEIDLGATVRVIYNNANYFYEKRPSGGRTAPNYIIVSLLENDTGETYFDGGGTEFFASVDKYEYQDDEDKYIKFPQVGVFK